MTSTDKQGQSEIVLEMKLASFDFREDGKQTVFGLMEIFKIFLIQKNFL